MRINGIAHLVLCVRHPEKVLPFYEAVLGFLEFETVYRQANCAYFIGGKTAIAITPVEEKHSAEKFEQGRPGLHHFCFRAYAREDIDRFHGFLLQIGAKVVHPPEDGPWAPGYYSVLFEDPEGLRLELNFVPGEGLLAEGTEFNPVGYDHLR